MLERTATTVRSLGLACAALLLMLVAHFRLVAPAQLQTKSAAVATEIRCTHGSVRTRTPGLHPSYMTRTVKTRRHLHELIE